MKTVTMFTISLAALAIAASLNAPATASNQSSKKATCLDGTDWQSYTTSFTRGSGTIAIKDGLPLCKSTQITLESLTMPDTWDGVSFNATALPQTKFASTTFIIPADRPDFKQTYTVAVPPECKNTQIDLYIGKGFEKITKTNDDSAAWLAGLMVKGGGPCITPAPATPSPTPSVLGASTDLPNTGAEGLIGAFGLTAMAGTAGLYLKQRFLRK